MPKPIILIDLDGTLIDTSERHFRVYKDIVNLYEISDTLSKEIFWNKKRQGKKTSSILPYRLSNKSIQGFSDEWLERIETRDYLSFDRLFQDSIQTLSTLQTIGYLALVTLRKDSSNLIWELEYFGLDRYFKKILVGSPLCYRDKTDIIKENIELKANGLNPIIIGDSEIDILTGKKLGLTTIAITRGIRSEEFLRKLKPDFCLNRLSELIEVLEKLGLHL
jgi:phosphoglycolate phosphatase